MSGDFSTILASGVQGSVQSDRVSGASEESLQRSEAALRLRESRQRAEKSAGVGSVENQTQQSSGEREGDGHSYEAGASRRRISLSDQKDFSEELTDQEKGAIDLSGNKGNHLDFFV